MCIEHSVAGFSNRAAQPDDLVYLAVKVGKKTLCGARFKLHEITNHKPWPDGERYVHVLSIKDVEFCQPFDMAVLSEVGGKYWSMMYVQASKTIRDKAACDLLDQTFSANKAEHFIPFEVASPLPIESVEPTTTTINGTIDDAPLTRDSIKIQAKLAEIGDRMGYNIWLPRNDRNRVLELWKPSLGAILEGLPLNYDTDTISTIENIDVLWIQGRTIVRAFEVEHTTSVYSGILRMADLMALQPNLSIKAHIVAPVERRAKVMQELSRPVFRHILANSCTFVSYSSIEELASEKRLEFMTDAVLKVYSESPKDFILG